MPTMGAFTTDVRTTRQIVNEVIDSVERHNETSRNFKTEFCNMTRKENVIVRQRSMTFQPSGSDTTLPNMQHLDERSFSLSDPKRYLLRGAMTRETWERGLATRDDIMEMHREAVDADYRFTTQMVLMSMLNDGGFWDAAMTTAPPTYKMNTFATTHDHYLAANVAGVVTLAYFTAMKRHIQEHGFGYTGRQGETSVAVFINGEQAQEIEDTAEWIDNTNDRIPGDVMNALQTVGLTPRFTAAGCAVIVDDWVPQYYMLAFDPLAKPCYWRNTDNPVADDLQVLTVEDDVQYVGIQDYVRYSSVRVCKRGAGCCYYLNSGTWTDPTGWEF